MARFKYNPQNKNEQRANYEDAMLTLGKHRDKILKEVDPDYLLWVLRLYQTGREK